jgi:hypothetical protein
MMRPETVISSIKLSQPAQRALKDAGIVTLNDVTAWSTRELLALHGVGPHTIRIVQPLLESLGLSFKP